MFFPCDVTNYLLASISFTLGPTPVTAFRVNHKKYINLTLISSHDHIYQALKLQHASTKLIRTFGQITSFWNQRTVINSFRLTLSQIITIEKNNYSDRNWFENFLGACRNSVRRGKACALANRKWLTADY